jgi:hypothetical protein
MAAQVGTFRQRMGVFSQLGDSDKGAWVRVFRDKGTIDPSQLDNLPQRRQLRFDQPTAASKRRQRAGRPMASSSVPAWRRRGQAGPGQRLGSDDIDGDTSAVTSPGCRRTACTPTSRTAGCISTPTCSFGGAREGGGDVGALQRRSGWNVWTSAGGLKLVPQVQYTPSKSRTSTASRASWRTSSPTAAPPYAAAWACVPADASRRLGHELDAVRPVSVIREFDGDSHFAIADNAFNGGATTKGTSGMLELGADVNMARCTSTAA